MRETDHSPQAVEPASSPQPGANPIGWILWHMLRVEDMWFQFFIQRQTEIWEREGWNEKFGLPARFLWCRGQTNKKYRSGDV